MAKKNETGKVNPSRPNKPDLKSARPIMTPDDTGRESPAPSGGNGGHSNGTVFGRVRDAASSVGSTVGGALTNGFRGLKNSMFGLKTVTASVSSGLDKMADYLHVPKRVWPLCWLLFCWVQVRPAVSCWSIIMLSR